MKQLKKFGSIYSEDEERVLRPWQQVRQFFLTPLAALLSRLGISPDMLSFTSVGLGIGFCLLAPFQFTLAFWLLVASVICDGLDGVEARLKRTNTTRGSFTDMFCDQLVVAFSTAGMAWKGSINPALAILLVSSRWIVRPSRMLLYIAIGLDFFFNINLLNILLVIYLLAFPMLALSFWRLRRAL
jgi:phosphatidylglycerophosphate synthase